MNRGPSRTLGDRKGIPQSHAHHTCGRGQPCRNLAIAIRPFRLQAREVAYSHIPPSRLPPVAPRISVSRMRPQYDGATMAFDICDLCKPPAELATIVIRIRKTSRAVRARSMPE